jgi:dTDP-4-amino-4,6-dideoxygalactose transaminase
MNDFKSEPQELKNEMLSAAQVVLESGWYVLGNHVKNFEKEWSTICDSKYGVGVANGMDAIEIALRALDICDGDEVITTSMTAFPTILGIIRAGAVPVLADVDPNTALLDPISAQRCVSSRTKAVVLVHLYGQVRDMDIWCDYCDSHNLYLIEDCAQSHLASWEGKAAGSFGIAGAYSFYPTKNLGAVGDGGMLVTNEFEIASKATKLRNYGQSVRYQHPILGMNSRLDEIHAAILSKRLTWLPIFTERRKIIAETYLSDIKNPIVNHLSTPQNRDSHVFHLFSVTSSRRDMLKKYLQERGVETLIHYPIPVHQQDPCINIKKDPIGLINCENHAATCLSLPCHPQMTNQDIEAVVSAVNEFSD